MNGLNLRKLNRIIARLNSEIEVLEASRLSLTTAPIPENFTYDLEVIRNQQIGAVTAQIGRKQDALSLLLTLSSIFEEPDLPGDTLS